MTGSVLRVSSSWVGLRYESQAVNSNRQPKMARIVVDFFMG